VPRIPTSKPQNVAQRAGPGGKINPTSLSGFFGQVASASAEASEAIRRADEEKQKLLDRNAENLQNIDQTNQLSELNEALINNPSDQHEQIVAEWTDKNSTSQAFGDASKETAEILRQKQELFVQKGVASSRLQTARKMHSESMGNAASLEKIAIENLDRESAIQAWDGLLSKEDMAVREQIIDSNLQKAEAALAREQESAVSDVISATTDEMMLQNDVQGLEASMELIESGQGEFAKLSETTRIVIKNDIFRKKQTIIAKRSKAFETVIDDAIENGVINKGMLESFLEQDLIMEDQINEINKIFSSEQRTLELAEEFKEQKNNPSYQTISAELDEGVLATFAEGGNPTLMEAEIRKFVSRIDRDRSLGTIAKNKLKAKLAMAASQAVLEDDNALGIQLGETWEDLTDESRKLLSDFAADASKVLAESSNAKMLLLTEENGVLKGFEQPFSEVLIGDMNTMADMMLAGEDPSNTIKERLSFYRVGRQRLRVRQFLLQPPEATVDVE
jgi:hypothetical protein